MVPLEKIDFVEIGRMVQEYVDALGLTGEVSHNCIYHTDLFDSERQVFKLRVGDAQFAMKVDRAAGTTNRLRNEYAQAERLYPHFQTYDKVGIPRPRYLSPSGEFFVSDFVGERLASVILRKDADYQKAGQVFKRAGMWLRALHEAQPAKETVFWTGWMVKAIDAALDNAPHADTALLERLRNQLAREAARLDQITARGALCHGDFHASNVILSRGQVFGCDFTEMTEKIALYDAVDFLKIDAYRLSVLDDVDETGISRQAQKMFFKGYQLSCYRDVFRLCMRGRLLLDWAGITEEKYETCEFQRMMFQRFGNRVQIAFHQDASKLS